MKRPILISVALGALAIGADAVDFEADVLPIFESKCAKCHMEGESKGGVAFDAEEIDHDIGGGRAIVPGDADGSELIELVTLPEDDDDRMPPPDKGRPLSKAEIDTLKEWIQSGASIGGEEPAMEKEKESDDGFTMRPEPIEGEWTNRAGKKIQATLVRVEGDKAVLRMNGRDYRYAISELSDADQAKVREFAEAWKKASGG